jgi:calcium-dependent protein kinase
VPEEDFFCLKLIDFNVSMHFKPGEQLIQKTGFLDYRAPELVEGGPIGYNQSVDLWSAAAVLFYLLSGKHAF